MAYWSIFSVVDFPISLIVFLTAWPIGNLLPDELYVNLLLAFLFGTLGSYQYYWIGSRLGKHMASQPWLRPLSLRTLFIATTLIAVVLGLTVAYLRLW
jgi:hypothetical protein